MLGSLWSFGAPESPKGRNHLQNQGFLRGVFFFLGGWGVVALFFFLLILGVQAFFQGIGVTPRGQFEGLKPHLIPRNSKQEQSSFVPAACMGRYEKCQVPSKLQHNLKAPLHKPYKALSPRKAKDRQAPPKPKHPTPKT